MSANADTVSVKQAPSIQETQQQSQQAAKNKQAADQAVRTAKQDSVAAQATVDHAQSKVDAAQADVAADKQKVADAQSDLVDSKNGGIEKAKQAVDQAASDLANAQDKNAQAQTALDQANADQKQQQAVTDQAQADYDLAQKQKGQAQSAVDQTQKDLADQQKYAAGLNEKNLNQAQSDAINERIDLESQKSDKEDELEAAQAEQDDAQEAVDELQGDSNDGQEEIDYTKNPHYQEMLDADEKNEKLQDVYDYIYDKQYALPNLDLSQEQVQNWHKEIKLDQVDPDDPETYNIASTIYNEFMLGFFPYDRDDFEKQYTSFDQLSESDWNVLTNFVLDMVNQARDYWGTAAPHITSNKVDQEIAQDFANTAIKNYHDDEDDSDYIEVDNDAKQLINEKYHVALGYEFDGENEQVIGDSYDSIAELSELAGHSSFVAPEELHDKNAFTMNDLKLAIYTSLAGKLSWSPDNYLLGEMEKPEGVEWSNYVGDPNNYQPTHLGVSFNHDEIIIVGIDDYDVSGTTPDKEAIPDTPHYADYTQAVKEAEEKADAAYKVANDLYNLVYFGNTEDNSEDQNTLSTRSLVRAAVSPAQQLQAAQKRLTAADTKVASLTQEIQQLDQQIAASQTKVDEITDTLGNLPAKQAEAQQKLKELQAKLAQVQADLTAADKVVAEKKAVLVQAQAELKTVSEQQAAAKEVADQASAQVADKNATLQAAQDYQYRMTHADELLTTAKEELALAEQAVIKAQTELAQAKDKQQAARAKLNAAQQKQAVANAEYQRAVSATKKAQQDVLNFKHHTKVVLPALHEETVQAATVKAAALPKTGSEQDSHSGWLGLLSLVLSALGLGVFFKEKDKRIVK